MRPHLSGTGSVTLRDHVSGADVWSGEVRFTDDDRRVEFVDRQGHPIALDKANRFSPVFSERTAADLDPLLDAMTELLEVLGGAGVAAFPAYGTLLGAVREGDFLGHDSDADLGYVSSRSTPVDVIRESFELQRVVVADRMGNAVIDARVDADHEPEFGGLGVERVQPPVVDRHAEE